MPIPSIVLLLLISLTSLPAAPLEYPKARKGDVVEDYHGTKVADPYRWLEEADSAETKEWIAAENELTYGWLQKIPRREDIRQNITKLWNYAKVGVPFKEGGQYFFSKNTGLQNQSVLYVTDDLQKEPRVLIDPNTLSSDGTVSLSTYSVRNDGKYLAYAVSTSGSDWIDWKVREIATGRDTDDAIQWAKFSGASWKKDGSGFYYSRFDAPDEKTKLQTQNYFHKVYFHRLGTPQAEDALVYERKDQKEWNLEGNVTDDGRYLLIDISAGTDPKNGLFYRDLADDKSPIVEWLPVGEATYRYIGNDGPVFYLVTDKNAPRRRLVSIDTRISPVVLREIVPEGEDTIDSVSYVGGKFIVSRLKDAHAAVQIVEKDGTPASTVDLPGLGTVSGFGGKSEDTETFFSYTSYTQPTAIYRYDVATGKTSEFFTPQVAFQPADYVTEQVFYPSKDGTKIPMFITYRKGLVRDGKNPTVLYGYGGFNISLTPGFSPSILAWLQLGGVYSVANLRGGDEYGEAWHQAGMLGRKQNVFDDFAAAAEWLIANKYTSTPKLAINGGSNGGLLVGASITQRPDLFGAAVAEVGVLDMLRFQKFTIGWAWTSDYGSSDNAEDFKWLYAYSPLHNIKPGKKYPPTLIMTSDHDDRVVPAHSFKFAAALQAAQGGDAPILIRIATKTGHGAGRPTSKIIEDIADRWAFLTEALDMPPAAK